MDIRRIVPLVVRRDVPEAFVVSRLAGVRGGEMHLQMDLVHPHRRRASRDGEVPVIYSGGDTSAGDRHRSPRIVGVGVGRFAVDGYRDLYLVSGIGCLLVLDETDKIRSVPSAVVERYALIESLDVMVPGISQNIACKGGTLVGLRLVGFPYGVERDVVLHLPCLTRKIRRRRSGTVR